MLESLLSHISVQALVLLIVGLPLSGALVNGIVSLVFAQYKRPEPRAFVIFISQMTVLLPFVIVILLWYILYGLKGASPSVITGPVIVWKGFLNQPLEFGLKADQLSLAMAFIIAFVGVIIGLYSVGFNENIKNSGTNFVHPEPVEGRIFHASTSSALTNRLSGEKNRAGFFSLFNLIFSLALLLVLTDSFFLFFVAWQIVGVAGLIFISRSFSDLEGIRVGTVYYVIEAISGSALLLVMFLIWKAFSGQADLGLDIFQFNSIQLGSTLFLDSAGIVCFALLVGVVARSLQFPLYVWMPGATRAPLPVFAFAYAVSSVLVAVYILIRLNFLLVLAPSVLQAMAIIGGVGCLFGAASALVEDDVKKLLSYFVISQAGLAFIGIGVGAFATTLFYIFVYAVYITALFLGIGSVITITGRYSLSQMGGIRKYLPVTFWATLVGALAAAGIYPFSGFFSENGIIWEAYQRGHGVLFLAAFVAAILNVIAIFRMIAVVFFGKADTSKFAQKRLEESSVSMLVTLVIASFAAIVVGWFGVGEAFGGGDHFRTWLEPGLATQMVHVIGKEGKFSELVIAVITTIFVAHAGLITWIIYVQKRRWPAALAARFGRTHALLKNGFYLDRLYELAIARPVAAFSEWVMWRGLDELIVDGVIVGSVGRGVRLMSEVVRKVKVKEPASYLFLIVVGLIVLIGAILFW